MRRSGAKTGHRLPGCAGIIVGLRGLCQRHARESSCIAPDRRIAAPVTNRGRRVPGATGGFGGVKRCYNRLHGARCLGDASDGERADGTGGDPPLSQYPPSATNADGTLSTTEHWRDSDPAQSGASRAILSGVTPAPTAAPWPPTSVVLARDQRFTLKQTSANWPIMAVPDSSSP